MSQTIARVTLLDRQTGQSASLDNGGCEFHYRDSVFKGRLAGRYLVWRVTFRLKPGGAPLIAYPELQRALTEHDAPNVAQVRETILRLRRRKSMVFDRSDENHRSAGSFFVNPILTAAQANAVHERARGQLKAGEKMPRYPMDGGGVKLAAAWLIERAGMTKGYGEGPVGLSTRHTLAVVNRGRATAADVVAFAASVRRRVFERFGVSLNHEPRLLGFDPSEVSGLSDALE